MGSKITKLQPPGGFAAETGAAVAIYTATRARRRHQHHAHDHRRHRRRRRDAAAQRRALGRRRPDRLGVDPDDSGVGDDRRASAIFVSRGCSCEIDVGSRVQRSAETTPEVLDQRLDRQQQTAPRRRRASSHRIAHGRAQPWPQTRSNDDRPADVADERHRHVNGREQREARRRRARRQEAGHDVR